MRDTSNNILTELAKANIDWENDVIPVALIDDTTPSDDPLIGYYDGGDYPKPANGSDFTVTWDAEGIFNLTN